MHPGKDTQEVQREQGDHKCSHQINVEQWHPSVLQQERHIQERANDNHRRQPLPYAQAALVVSIPNDQTGLNVPDNQRGERRPDGIEGRKYRHHSGHHETPEPESGQVPNQ